MPSKLKKEHRRRNRPVSNEPLVAMNIKLPISAVRYLREYAHCFRRSESWVLSDLISLLPEALAAREEEIEGVYRTNAEILAENRRKAHAGCPS